MLEKPQPPNAFFFTPENLTKLVKFMMVLPQWIGWNKSKNAELPSLQPPQHAFGKNIALTSSTHQVTLILQLKLNARFASSTVRLPFLIRLRGLSLNPKLFGVKLINIKFQEFVSSIRWIASAPIFTVALT